MLIPRRFFVLLVLAASACGQGAQNASPTHVELPTNAPAPTPIPATLPDLPTADPNATADVILSPGATVLRDGLTLDRLPIEENNPDDHYVINAVKPVLRGDAALTDPFNTAVDLIFSQTVDDFKPQAREAFSTAPVDVGMNTSSLDMRLDVFTPGFNFISLRFPIMIYMAGAAHPFTTIKTLTYDLRTGKVLSLADLFLPGSAYLEYLSTQAVNTITPILGDAFFSDGALPTEQNYRSWNLMPDGLVITFEQYQVGPGAAGSQEVTIPYAGELGAMLQPDILSALSEQ